MTNTNCPYCGAVLSGEKTCPVCGKKLEVDA